MRLTLDLDSYDEYIKVYRYLSKKYGVENLEVRKSSTKSDGYHIIVRGLSMDEVVKLRLKYDDKKRIAIDNMRIPLTRNVLFDVKIRYNYKVKDKKEVYRFYTVEYLPKQKSLEVN